MQIPIRCPNCGDQIGVEDISFYGQALVSNICPGRGRHKPPVEKIRSSFFGLVEETEVYYLETQTSSVSKEYIGPKSRLLVWFVLVFYESPIHIDGKWCSWSSSLGFFGAGADQI
jgi:hypothetical protein